MTSNDDKGATYVDGPRRIDDIPDEWRNFITDVLKVIKAADDPTVHRRVTVGATYFREALRAFTVVVESAIKLARIGRASSGSSAETEYAESIEWRIRDFCLAFGGNWLYDRLGARAVFLVHLREMLQEHEGEYVLITPARQRGEWQLSSFAETPRELVEKAKGQGLGSDQFFVQQVVHGADRLPWVDLGRPSEPFVVEGQLSVKKRSKGVNDAENHC